MAITETAELRQDEAVLLAHALVARLAEDAGARILFIKGPTAVAQGVRPPRPSSDVDVLVDPATFEALCSAIESAGWTRRFVPLLVPRAADLAFDHSAHFIHRDWPCDLDVHHSFPGFLAPASEVFESLWARRTQSFIAGVGVDSPDLLGQALVVGLHALRDPHKVQSRADLQHVETVLLQSLDDESRAALDRLAVATGARTSAQALLEAVGVVTPTDLATHAGVDAWRVRQEFGTVAGSLWLVEFVRSPWRQRPAVLMRAVVPRREVLFPSHLAGTATRWQLVRAHVMRWGRALRGFPQAARVLRALRDAQRS